MAVAPDRPHVLAQRVGRVAPDLVGGVPEVGEHPAEVGDRARSDAASLSSGQELCACPPTSRRARRSRRCSPPWVPPSRAAVRSSSQPDLEGLGAATVFTFSTMDAPAWVALDDLPADVGNRTDAHAEHDEVEVFRDLERLSSPPSRPVPERLEVRHLRAPGASAPDQLVVVRAPSGPAGQPAHVDERLVLAPSPRISPARRTRASLDVGALALARKMLEGSAMRHVLESMEVARSGHASPLQDLVEAVRRPRRPCRPVMLPEERSPGR